MSARGVLFALTDEEANRFLTASSDEEVEELIEEIEEKWDEEWLGETDKAWDAIHRCLTDGALEHENGEYPLNRCILGGKQLYKGDDYIVAFVSAPEVADVAAALMGVMEPWFRERFEGLRNTDYPQEYLAADSLEDDFAYSWEWFQTVRDLYRRAADAKRAVIFTVDQ